jgi:hypothetical protein
MGCNGYHEHHLSRIYFASLRFFHIVPEPPLRHIVCNKIHLQLHVPHLARETSGWRSMILLWVLRILLRHWEWVYSGTWGQSRRSVGFRVGEVSSHGEACRYKCKRVRRDKENRNNHQQYEDKISSHRVLDVSCHTDKSVRFKLTS